MPAASLAVLYSNYTQLVDARRRPASRRSPTCAARSSRPARPAAAPRSSPFRVLRAAGLDPDRDVTRQGLGVDRVGRRAQGRQDRRVLLERRPADGGDPGPRAHVRASRSGSFPATTCCRRSGATTASLYFPLEIPAGVYPGVDQPVPVVGVANVLVVNRSMPDDLAYDITRVLFEKQAELAAIHPEARNLSLERGAAQGSPAPFHPGAIRYYAEQKASGSRDRSAAGADPDLEPFEESQGARASGRAAAWSRRSPIGLSLYALYWVLFIVQPQVYRVSFLLVALVLTFLLFPARARRRCAGGVAASTGCSIGAGGRRARRGRSSTSARSSIARPIRSRSTWCSAGVAILLVLEATRRSVGLDPAGDGDRLPRLRVLAARCFDRIGLSLIAHRGYDDRSRSSARST